MASGFWLLVQQLLGMGGGPAASPDDFTRAKRYTFPPQENEFAMPPQESAFLMPPQESAFVFPPE